MSRGNAFKTRNVFLKFCAIVGYGSSPTRLYPGLTLVPLSGTESRTLLVLADMSTEKLRINA
jgi:hypothetical protein